MANDTIASGGTLSLTAPVASGTEIIFANSPSVGGTLSVVTSAFAITTVSSGGTTSIASVTLGGPIVDFLPQTPDQMPQDVVLIQNVDSLYAALDVASNAATENRSFNNQMLFSAESGNVFFVMPNGAVDPSTNSPIAHVDANTTLILDEIRGGLFGTEAPGATIEIQPILTGNIVNVIVSSINVEITPCFVAGTGILTTAGEVAVEDLAPGDRVITRGGEDVAVVWIGHRKLDILRHPRPDAVRPVIIEPDALAEGVPSRRLTLSPDHALYLDGVLVPAKALLNGTTIRADATATQVHYLHVELPVHDILFAEGAAAESFLDTGHRGVFDNSAAPLLLHPDTMQQRREGQGCAPLCLGGPVLEKIRERLARRRPAAIRFG